jgi:hypothetical protein
VLAWNETVRSAPSVIRLPCPFADGPLSDAKVEIEYVEAKIVAKVINKNKDIFLFIFYSPVFTFFTGMFLTMR